MPKSPFCFRLGQRVNVPGKKKGIQGTVGLPRSDHERAPGLSIEDGDQTQWFVRYLQEDGTPVFFWFTEADLLAVNTSAE